MSDDTDNGLDGEDAGKEVIVRSYGLLDPLNWSEDCDEELTLMTRLWNRLVEIERDIRVRYVALTAADPAIQVLDARFKAFVEEQAELVKQRKATNAKARKREPSPEITARLKAISEEITSMKPELKAARAASREKVKPQLTLLEDERRAAVKVARQQSGLFWGNYNAVVQGYETARKAALKKGAELKFHRNDGSGRLMNQLQGGLSVERLFAGANSQLGIKPLPADAFTHASRGERRRLQRSTVSFKVHARGGEAKIVQWPVIVHRDIPADAAVKTAQIVRRRMANTWRWTLVLTCTRERKPQTATLARPPAAVDLGWRMMSSGLRVATVLRRGATKATFVVLPKAYLKSSAHVEALRSQRDLDLNDALLKLRCLDWKTAPEDLAAVAKPILQAPKIGFGRVATLAFRWRDHAWALGARDELEAWRRRDKRLWLEETNLHDKLQARRKDIFRNAALEIVENAGSLILEDFDLRSMSTKEMPTGEVNPHNQALRHQRGLAAPSLLRSSIVDVAARLGVPVERKGGRSTWVCHVCETDIKPAKPEEVIQVCPHCKAMWDQDVNACHNLLRSAEPPASAMAA